MFGIHNRILYIHTNTSHHLDVKRVDLFVAFSDTLCTNREHICYNSFASRWISPIIIWMSRWRRVMCGILMMCVSFIFGIWSSSRATVSLMLSIISPVSLVFDSDFSWNVFPSTHTHYFLWWTKFIVIFFMIQWTWWIRYECVNWFYNFITHWKTLS